MKEERKVMHEVTELIKKFILKWLWYKRFLVYPAFIPIPIIVIMMLADFVNEWTFLIAFIGISITGVQFGISLVINDFIKNINIELNAYD